MEKQNRTSRMVSQAKGQGDIDTVSAMEKAPLVVAFVAAGLSKLSQPRSKNSTSTLSTPTVPNRVPHYGRIVLYLMTGTILLVSGFIVAGRREVSHPFPFISDLLGEDARQAALAYGFLCPDRESGSSPRTSFVYCVKRDAEAMFSGILLRMSGTSANAVSFSLGENKLTLGDLVLLWGRPEIWVHCETIGATWPTRNITGQVVQRQAGGISYFSPVTSVSFTRSRPTRRGTLDWGRIVLNDLSPDCRKMK